MARIRQRPVLFLVVALFVMGAHFVLNAYWPSQSESISFGFFLSISLLAWAVLWWRGWQSAPALRRGWFLFTSALMLWFTATVIAARAHFFNHASPTTANIDDFFYFYYGVPILLAIAAPDDGEQDSLFFWFDGIQAAAVGALAYIEIFAVIPFSGVPKHPLPVLGLIWIFDIENLILATFATARMAASPRHSAYRRFFQVLAIFLWTYGICAGVYNHIVSRVYDAGVLDVLVDIPLLLLVGMAAFSARLPGTREERLARKPVALFLDNARPTLLGLALVLLGTAVAREHFKIAMATILGAFVLYGVRSAMLQTRLVNTQKLLEAANSRLAEMTLEDGLTGIANRRCFDQRLHHEWSRAHRNHGPLSLLLIDIDHFKKLNDTYGHLVGDECLIQVAQTMRAVLHRPGDLLARYGGEEFVALLPETEKLGAQNVAARLQLALRTTAPVPAIERQVTVSIGVTTWQNHKQVSVQQFVDTADRALYNAKQRGRDRVEFLSLEDKRDFEGRAQLGR